MFTRHLSGPLLAALGDTPAVILIGPRQAGKSTLALAITPTHPARVLSLDDAGVLAAAQTDPDGFVRALDGPVVLDEIQRAPGLFRAIKAAVDRQRTPGRFLLTGSANVLTLPQAADALVGRTEVLVLWPLSQGEIDGTPDRFIDAVFARTLPRHRRSGESRKTLLARVVRGGYPEILMRADVARRRAWFGSYITTILQREVRDLASIESLPSLPRLLGLLAARSASLLNYAEISRALGLPQTTLKRYMALLEQTFLIRLIPPWSGNLSKRFVKTPRVVLTDSGLLAYLIAIGEVPLQEGATGIGPLLESFVAMELTKQQGWSASKPTMFHYRTHTGEEVDLVLETADGRLAGIEVKASTSVSAVDFKGLRALQAAVGPRFVRGVVLYTGVEALPFGPQLWALPLDALWRLDAPSGRPMKTPSPAARTRRR
jgi:predicted AAA+ superfamily ATPase